MEPLLLAWFGCIFALGAVVGSWLNVCIVRIPYEKSVLWPSSRCGNCFRPVRWYDNIPLISYWILRGRCRSCGETFSMRYFFVELLTGLVFVALFWIEILQNVSNIPLFARDEELIAIGALPKQAWFFWMGHAILASFLIVTTVTDLDHLEIPLPVTIAGTVAGLVLATCFPWPWPSTSAEVAAAARTNVRHVVAVLGWQPWPLWRPDQLPSWLAPGSWQLGLATGLAGVLAGIILLRGVRFLFGVGRGVEGLGLGDADLMMMAGAFLGWQAVLIAFFVSVFPALLLGIGWMIVRRDQTLPFGPSLALGTLLTLLTWKWLGPQFQMLFFDRVMLIALGVTGAILLLGISFFLRLTRGNVTETPEG